MRRALSWFGDWPDGSWFVFGVLGSGLTGMSAAQTATYSDYLPSAVAPRPPTPDADVPPERLLRRLWLVWAELAFDQSGGMRSGSFMGWMLLLALEAGLALLVGAFLATGDLTAPDRAAAAPILVWLVIAWCSAVSVHHEIPGVTWRCAECSANWRPRTLPRPARFPLELRCGLVTRRRATTQVG